MKSFRISNEGGIKWSGILQKVTNGFWTTQSHTEEYDGLNQNGQRGNKNAA